MAPEGPWRDPDWRSLAGWCPAPPTDCHSRAPGGTTTGDRSSQGAPPRRPSGTRGPLEGPQLAIVRGMVRHPADRMAIEGPWRDPQLAIVRRRERRPAERMALEDPWRDHDWRSFVAGCPAPPTEWHPRAPAGTPAGDRSPEGAPPRRTNGTRGPVEGPRLAIARRVVRRPPTDWHSWSPGGTPTGDRSSQGAPAPPTDWHSWPPGTPAGDRSPGRAPPADRLAPVVPWRDPDWRSLAEDGCPPSDRLPPEGPWRDHDWRSFAAVAGAPAKWHGSTPLEGAETAR